MNTNTRQEKETGEKTNQELEHKKTEDHKKKKKNSSNMGNISGRIEEKSEEYYNSPKETKEKKPKLDKKGKDDLELWKKINIKSILSEQKLLSEDQGNHTYNNYILNKITI